MSDLRTALYDLSHDGSAISTYPGKLQVIAKAYPHTIRALDLQTDAPLEDFNCVMHALGLIGRFKTTWDFRGHFRADTAFVQFLIDSGSLAPCLEVVGGLVVWLKDGVLRHVGVIASEGRAISKWGIGYMYDHNLDEVPQDFGNELAFYSALPPDDAWNLFKRYYTSRGVTAIAGAHGPHSAQ